MGDKAFTVTLKRGKGFEDPWIVISADSAEQATAHIEAALGVDPGTHAETPLVNLVGRAAKSFQAPGLIEEHLGGAELGAGKPVEDKAGGGSESKKPAPAKRKAPAKSKAKPKPKEAEAAEGPPWDEEDPVLADIAKAQSVTSLRRVWARHKAEWDKDKHGPALAARKKEIEG